MADESAKLGEILIQKGWLKQEELEQVLTKQKLTREFLGIILLKDKYITEEQLVTVLSEQFKLPCVRLKNFYVDWNLVMRFSASLILDHQCFPLRQGDDSITVGITNPLDAWAHAQIEAEVKGRSVRLVLVTASDMRELLERYRHYVNIRIRRSLVDES